MMNLIKYKSVGESGGFLMIRNGFSALFKSPPQKAVSSKHLLMVETRLGFSDLFMGTGVSAGFSTSSASETVGSRSFFNTLSKSATEQHVSFNQFPGLMVPGSTDEKNSETRRLLRFNRTSGYFETDLDCNSLPVPHPHGYALLGFNPTSGYFETDLDCNSLPVPHGYACHGSAYGWLFLVGDDLDTKLMNPFTGEEIQLPSVKTLPRAYRGWMDINKWYVLKAVFSSDPSLQPAPLVMVIHRGDSPRLAYCKPGDISWTSLHHRHTKRYYEDVIFYNDQFYAISQPDYIMAYDIRRLTDDKDQSVKKSILIASGSKGLEKHRGKLYLVVLDGVLIKLRRKLLRSEECKCHLFMIWRFVASENKWVKVESLGDHALFLGRNTSFALQASEHPGCIPNAIYFTDGYIQQNQPFGYDMGVYKLSDQSVMPLLQKKKSVMPILQKKRSVMTLLQKKRSMPLFPIGSDSFVLDIPSPVWVTKVSSYAVVKKDMQSGDIPILSSGQQSLGDDNGDVLPAPQSKTPPGKLSDKP